jgi:O-antigen/teichoic acid export membrane protein
MDNKIIRLLKSSSGYTIGSVVNRAMFMISLPIMTRYLAPEEYGILSVVNVVIGLMMTLYGLAANDFIIRFYYEQQSEDQRRRFLGGILSFILSLSLFVSIVLTFLGEGLFKRFFPSIPFAPYIILGIWACFVHMLEMVPDALFRIRNEVFLFVSVNFTKSILAITLSIIAVVALNRGAEGPLAAALTADIILGFFFIYYLKDKVRLNFSYGLIKACLKFSLPVLALLLGSVLLESADRLMLQHFVDMSVVGQYSIGSTLASVLIMIASSMDVAWTPFFYATAKQESQDQAKAIFAQAATYLGAGILFCALIPIILRHEIVYILAPPAYYAVIEVIPLIMMGAILNGLFFIPVRGIYLKNKTIYLPFIIALGLLINIILNYLLIPRWQMAGAASATIVAALIMLILGFVIAQRLYYIDYQWRRWSLLILACSLCFILDRIVPSSSILISLLLRIAILGTFPLLLLVFGFFNREDVGALVLKLFGGLGKAGK